MNYLSERLRRYSLVISVAATGWLTATAQTQADQGEHHHGEQRQQAAHVHGTGRLNLVLEGGAVHIELDSPAANLLGFEHPPVSAADRARLEQAVAALEDGDRLFRFDRAAACQQADVAITSALLERAHGRSDQSPAGDHADIVVDYRFQCRHPERLARLELGLFATFPRMERLQLQFILGDRQGGATLTGADPVVRF